VVIIQRMMPDAIPGTTKMFPTCRVATIPAGKVERCQNRAAAHSSFCPELPPPDGRMLDLHFLACRGHRGGCKRSNAQTKLTAKEQCPQSRKKTNFPKWPLARFCRWHGPRSPILARAVGRSSAVSPLPPSWTPPASLPRNGLNACETLKPLATFFKGIATPVEICWSESRAHCPLRRQLTAGK
jgi:hypothetical protein